MATDAIIVAKARARIPGRDTAKLYQARLEVSGQIAEVRMKIFLLAKTVAPLLQTGL